MDALTKFMLNSIESILSNATSDPNVHDIHRMINGFASRSVDHKDTNSAASVIPLSLLPQDSTCPKLKSFSSPDKISCYDMDRNKKSSYASSDDEDS